jgi:hypothetical protein
MITLDGWRSDALTRYCAHGSPEPSCEGDRCYAPCLPTEYVYCAHGIDARARTSTDEPRCAWCRGITRRLRNPSTWRAPSGP